MDLLLQEMILHKLSKHKTSTQLFQLFFLFAYFTSSAQNKPTIGPELNYRYDLRSSIGLGCHLTYDKDLPVKTDGSCLAHEWIATYELRYFFSKQTLFGEDISIKYFPYVQWEPRKFWRPIFGFTISHQTDFKQNSLYCFPSAGITCCGLFDLSLAYIFPFNSNNDLPKPQSYLLEFRIRPFMLKYVWDKRGK